MSKVKRYLWDFDIKKNIELTIEMQHLDKRLNEYINIVSKT